MKFIATEPAQNVIEKVAMPNQSAFMDSTLLVIQEVTEFIVVDLAILASIDH